MMRRPVFTAAVLSGARSALAATARGRADPRARWTARCRASRARPQTRNRCAARSRAKPGARRERPQRQRPCGRQRRLSPFARAARQGDDTRERVQHGRLRRAGVRRPRAAARRLQRPDGAVAAAARPGHDRVDRDDAASAAQRFDPAALPALNVTDFTGGTHFIVRADGTLLVPTNNGRLLHIAVDPGGLRQPGLIDLTACSRQERAPLRRRRRLRRARLGSGQRGHRRRGAARGRPAARDLPEASRSPRTSPPTRRARTSSPPTALYRLKVDRRRNAARRLAPAAAPGLTDSHAGRIHLGPGTPPVVLADGLVAVADGVNPPRVVVDADQRPRVGTPALHRAGLQRGLGKRRGAARRGRARRSSPPTPTATTTSRRPSSAHTSTGGMARIVVGKRGCRTAWTNTLVSPSAQAVVSRQTGLLYTTVKPKGLPDAWNLAAIDWRTGEQRFSVARRRGPRLQQQRRRRRPGSRRHGVRRHVRRHRALARQVVRCAPGPRNSSIDGRTLFPRPFPRRSRKHGPKWWPVLSSAPCRSSRPHRHPPNACW